MKRKTNAQVLREILAIDDAHRRENPDAEPYLTDHFREVIEPIAQLDDDDLVNVKLNKVLKPSKLIDTK